MKCVNCIHYKENPKFDYYGDNPNWYAECEKRREDILETEFDGVFQEIYKYEVDCSDYVRRTTNLKEEC